ncbi:hypothetical protein WJX84_002555 [Apatococcus fuscideae]|uniref:protein-tyrosine sulfotransferase n=1 Tax=Apatococcus fuscideae TaxID=2026836 RepID=A0AAW1TEN4_9CHLO
MARHYKGRLGASLILCSFLSTCCRAVDGQTQALTPDQIEQQISNLQTLADEPHADHRTHFGLASLLHQLDSIRPDGGTRLPRAKRAYRDAIATAPTEAAARALQGNLGALLLASGDAEEALNLLEDPAQPGQGGDEFASMYAGAAFNKGKALGVLGRADEADAAFLQALEVSRQVAVSSYARSFAALRQQTDESAKELTSAIQYLKHVTGRVAADADSEDESEGLEEMFGWLNEIAPQDESWLHFAMFSLLESQGDRAGAWEQLQLANRLQKHNVDASTDPDATLLQMVTNVFPTWEFRKQMAPQERDQLNLMIDGGLGLRNETPVFIVGMARSGSTLVEQILASHSWGHGAGEDTAFAPLLPELIGAVQERGLSSEVFHEYAHMYLDRMQAKAIDQGAGSPPPTRIVDKMLRNCWHVGYINMMMPDACLIQTVRHPLDIALSCFKQPFEGRGTPWAWDLDDIALTIERVEQVMEHWGGVMPGKVLRVPYEHLIASPETVVKGILQHCNMPWEPSVLDFHTNRRSVSTASLAQVRQKLYTMSIGSWRAYESELEPLHRRLAPLISKYEDEWGLQPQDTSLHQEL